MRAPTKYLDPAHNVILKVAGPEGRLADGIKAVAKITGKSYTQVWRWMRPRDNGGTGGLIPSEHAQELLNWARKRRVSLVADDFFGKRVA